MLEAVNINGLFTFLLVNSSYDSLFFFIFFFLFSGYLITMICYRQMS